MLEIRKQAFAPKARLVQILGEHLIKDATVGLLELVKNSYDADATQVRITMHSLNTDAAKIEIADNGSGMDEQAFVTKWMNPASGHKQLQKDQGQRTPLGRLPLGEKGVGRFATQQIGNHLLMVSKTKEMLGELVVNIDWTHFDQPEKDLSEAHVEYSIRDPIKYGPEGSGVSMEITGLKTKWSVKEVEKVSNSLRRMKSPFKGATDFDVSLKFENCSDEFSKYEDLDWTDILERAHYKFFGIVDREGILDFEYDFNMPGFEHNHKEGKVSLLESGDVEKSDMGCGGFIVNLHVYDKEKRFLRAAGIEADLRDLKPVFGISIYRDGIRILPYGEQDNDWLNLGYRRIQNPGGTISNDQVIGMIELNQTENPLLKDKTNREGLIENEAYVGFTHLALAVVDRFEKEMLDDRRKLRPKKEKTPQEIIQSSFANIRSQLEKVSEDPEVSASIQAQVDEILEVVGEQEEVFEIERNTLLNLAGTGLAAERFTHEFSRLVAGANAALERLVRLIVSDYDREPKIRKQIDTIRGALEALRNDIRLLGPMFYIKKAANEKELDIRQIVDNTLALQEVAIEKAKIQTEVVGDSFTVMMREGSCMQVLNNLLDNSIFWLAKKSETDNRKIRIILDKDEKAIYISDSGPGVVGRYKDKIFEPFFSMKGEEGRGLGLYIAKEIMQEKNWDIALVDTDDHPELLKGASFKVTFNGKAS